MKQTKLQTILIWSIAVVAVLLGLSLIFNSGKNVGIDRDACLAQGSVWDESAEVCLENQARVYPQSYAVFCGSDTFDFTTYSGRKAQLVSSGTPREIIELQKASSSSGVRYEAAGDQLVFLQTNQRATIRQNGEVVHEGCRLNNKTDATPNDSSRSITLGVGETAVLSDITLTLENIVSDNRCPQDVVCIQAGAVVVRVTLTAELKQREVRLNSAAPAYQFEEHELMITHVMPNQFSDSRINSEDYRVTFRLVTSSSTKIR